MKVQHKRCDDVQAITVTKLWRRSVLASAVLVGAYMMLPTAIPSAVASEWDVYEQGGAEVSQNGPVITMMLDTSGSMGGKLSTIKTGSYIPDAGSNSLINDYGLEENDSRWLPFVAKIAEKPNINFQVEGVGPIDGRFYYTRLARLKLAMMSLLADEIVSTDQSEIKPQVSTSKAIRSGNFKIGLGRYPSQTLSGLQGEILLPANSLTNQHRYDLINTIAGLKAGGRTPSAHAYAEAGAYMLGTKTANITKEKRYQLIGMRYFVSNSKGSKFYKCNRPSDSMINLKNRNTSEEYKLYGCSGGGTDWTEVNEASLTNDPTLIKLTGINGNKWSPSQEEYAASKAKDIWIKEGNEWSDNQYSGFSASSSSTKDSLQDNLTYLSPILQSRQCSADGIYFLTDGIPDLAFEVGNNSDIGDSPAQLMLQSLSNENEAIKQKVNQTCISNMEDSLVSNDGKNDEYRGFTCIGAYAQALNNSELSKGRLVTAVAGFGKDFSTANAESCTNSSSNACKAYQWGDVNSNYGQGGFYHVEESQDIASSFVNFANSLMSDYAPQQGDGLTISADITDATTSSSFAFLPLLEPRPGSNKLIWNGNVNKYKVKDGTLFDKNKKHIYNDVSGAIKNNTTEFWNDSGSPDGGAVRAMEVKTDTGATETRQPAGAYAKLAAPTSTASSSTRKVYVERANGTMGQIQVVDSKPAGIFTSLGYTKNLRQKQHYLLNFLGYSVPVFNDAGKRISDDDYKDTDAATLTNMDLTPFVPASSVKILGGINNSKPQEVLYGSVETYDPSSKTSSTTRTIGVLYGSTDGAVHLLNGATGEEYFAFIPKPILTDDRNIAALKQDSTQLADGSSNQTGKVAYGVDAPWLVDSVLNRTYAENTITYQTNAVNGKPAGYIRAYGGLGRGGIGFYGLDITDKTSPSLLFSIDNTTTGFSRLGSTWSKPVPATINYQEDGSTTEKKVLFLSGGYDLCYDNPDFDLGINNANWQVKNNQTGYACANKSQTVGNVVYMIDAANGNLLWKATKGGSSPSVTALEDVSATQEVTNPYLSHSIPGEVAAIDVNKDGIVDNIYFADLGGQMFRADFKGDYIKDTGIKSKVTRILKTEPNNKPSGYIPLRFYQRPVISAYRFNLTKNSDGDITAVDVDNKGTNETLVATVASGDRNSPLAVMTERQANQKPNKLISLWNPHKINDIENSEGAAKLYLTGSGSDLIELDYSGVAASSDMSIVNKAKLLSGNKKGWYANLTYFKGDSVQDTNSDKKVESRTGDRDDIVGNSVNYLRAFGQPVLRGGRLFVSIYNNQAYIPAPEGSCTPVPTGVTEAQEYCLPFGKCENGRGTALLLGAGVASANFAAVDLNSNLATLITPTKIDKGASGGGGGGNEDEGTQPILEEEKSIFASLYALLPNAWYERLSGVTNSQTNSDDDQDDEDGNEGD